MSETKLSVVIPVYNREEMVVKCLDAIAEQSLSQDLFEVIIVDDCSSDRTVEVVSHYSKIKNLKLICLAENSGGASKPRNIGIEAALGKYIIFIDSDDTITNQALELALDLALSDDLDMVIIPISFGERNSYTSLFDDYPEGFSKKQYLSNKEIGRLVFTNPGVIGRLYKAVLLKESGIRFSEKMSIYEDTLFARFIYSVSDSVGMVPVAEANYIPAPALNSANLSLLKRTIERCVNYLLETIRLCHEIPDEIISISKKTRILNNSFCRDNIFNIINNPRGYKALAQHINVIIPYLYDEGIREKAKGLIRKVCAVKSLDDRRQLAMNYFQRELDGFQSAAYYKKVWLWQQDVVVVEFDIDGSHFGIDIHPAMDGYHLIELIVRDETINLDINWGNYGCRTDNRIQLFYHPALLGLEVAFIRISQLLSFLVKEILNKKHS